MGVTGKVGVFVISHRAGVRVLARGLGLKVICFVARADSIDYVVWQQ